MNAAECWPWEGPMYPNGYGRKRVNGRYVLAHRAAYESAIGPIPPGLTIDHLCRNRACVNPAHMEPVTRGENVLRGEGITAQHARKKGCPFCGRDYSVLTRTDGRTYRVCKPCHYDRTSNPELQRIRRERRKERTSSTQAS